MWSIPDGAMPAEFWGFAVDADGRCAHCGEYAGDLLVGCIEIMRRGKRLLPAPTLATRVENAV